MIFLLRYRFIADSGEKKLRGYVQFILEEDSLHKALDKCRKELALLRRNREPFKYVSEISPDSIIELSLLTKYPTVINWEEYDEKDNVLLYNPFPSTIPDGAFSYTSLDLTLQPTSKAISRKKKRST
jgi:hypothetical protein